jgi:hypothetical protein
MTAKQKAAREKFKKVVAEASKLRKKNPKLTQAQAVKQAWAISYSKDGVTKKKSAPKKKAATKKVAAIKIIEKGESKSAKPKATYQQVRSKKGTFKGLKKVGAASYYGSGKRVFSSSLRVGEKYEWIDGATYLEVKYIGLSEKHPNVKAGVKYGDGKYLFQFTDDGSHVKLSSNAVFQSLRTIPKKVGAASSKVKARKRRSTEMHTDTKSHNVNIKVVSGMPSYKDPDMARELELYADNDSTLYFQRRKPILINLGKKYKKGTYDIQKAAKLWRYYIDAALEKYNKEFGSKGDKWYELMSVADRNLLALEYAKATKDEFDFGNFTEK